MSAADLRVWMDQHGYSVRRLARELGVAPSTVQRWRTSPDTVPPYLVLALAQLSPAVT